MVSDPIRDLADAFGAIPQSERTYLGSFHELFDELSRGTRGWKVGERFLLYQMTKEEIARRGTPTKYTLTKKR